MIRDGAELIMNVKQVLEKYEEVINLKNINYLSSKQVPKEYKNLYNEIDGNGTTSDELSKKLNISIVDVNFQLTMLEIDGFIERFPGNKYIKIGDFNV